MTIGRITSTFSVTGTGKIDSRNEVDYTLRCDLKACFHNGIEWFSFASQYCIQEHRMIPSHVMAKLLDPEHPPWEGYTVPIEEVDLGGERVPFVRAGTRFGITEDRNFKYEESNLAGHALVALKKEFRFLVEFSENLWSQSLKWGPKYIRVYDNKAIVGYQSLGNSFPIDFPPNFTDYLSPTGRWTDSQYEYLLRDLGEEDE